MAVPGSDPTESLHRLGFRPGYEPPPEDEAVTGRLGRPGPPDSPGIERAVLPTLVLLIAASSILGLWYASQGLHPGRYWDEHFSMRNVRVLLGRGWGPPANGYYQALSYLPQTGLMALSEGLHRWTDSETFAVFDAERQFTPTAFLLARGLQVLYGAGALLVTFLVGRSLFGAGTGLLAAFLLAATPWHLQASTIFKPDILLMFTVLLAFWWSLKAIAEPTLPRFALAGAGVALAVSSKLTGSLAFLPLLVGALRSKRPGRDRIRGLLTAGAAGTALFVLVNPYFPIYAEYFGRNLGHYTRRAASYGGTRLEVLWREVELLTSWAVHGRVLGFVALVGTAVFTVHLLRKGSREDQATTTGWMFLSFPLGFSLTYALFTPHFKANNFLPVIPFTSLLAAWLLSRIWRRATGRWSFSAHSPALVAASVLLVGALAPRPFLHAYRGTVPTTAERARDVVQRTFRRLDPDPPRLVFVEAADAEVRSRLLHGPRGREAAAMAVIDRLERVSSSRLDRADGEIFPEERLRGGGADPYWRRILAVPRSAVRRIGPEPFEVRGLEQVAIAHPWSGAGPPRTVGVVPSGDGDAAWLLPLPPALEDTDLVSIQIPVRAGAVPPRLEAGGRRIPVWPVAGTRRPRLFLSERLPVDSQEWPLRLRSPETREEWRPEPVRILPWMESGDER